MTLTTAPSAGAQQIATGCGQSIAPLLCSVKKFHARANHYRLALGRSRLVVEAGVSTQPHRRGWYVWLWDRRRDRAKAAWRLAQRSPVTVGQQLAAARGWTGSEWTALYTLWNYESGWSPTALNASSGACGIPQFVPCRYWGDTRGQITAGLDYIAARYGSPSGAMAFWYANGWY